MPTPATIWNVSENYRHESSTSASYHQERSDDPVNEDTKRDLNPYPPVSEDVV